MKAILVALLCCAPALAQAHYGHYGKYLLPDPVLTPGKVNTAVIADPSGDKYYDNGVEVNICAKDFSTKPFRHTTEKTKKTVCAEYGAQGCPNDKTMEVDHLIPLEIGGEDSILNLWIQPAPDFHEKDHEVEDKLKPMVCKKLMTLKQAQACIVNDWVVCEGTIKTLEEKHGRK